MAFFIMVYLHGKMTGFREHDEAERLSVIRYLNSRKYDKIVAIIKTIKKESKEERLKELCDKALSL